MSLLGLATTALGGAAGGPAGAAAGAQLPGILSNLFGGAGRDAQRQARADWFRTQAIAGSPTAARILYGGVANTASHEAPMYTAAIAAVRTAAPAVLNQAINLGPYWDTTDNDSSDKMRAKVNAELATLGLTALGTAGVTTLPLMTSTATYNPMTAAAAAAPKSNTLVLMAVGLALVVALILMVRGKR